MREELMRHKFMREGQVLNGTKGKVSGVFSEELTGWLHLVSPAGFEHSSNSLAEESRFVLLRYTSSTECSCSKSLDFGEKINKHPLSSPLCVVNFKS